MQRARTRGEGQYEVFDPAVHRRATGMLRLETDLRRALARQEFHVMYQPIVDLRAERISGFEALVRWRHGERGLIAPGEFIPIAEQSGLIVPIGSYVLETACRQVAEWRRRFPRLDHLYVNVNLSARHLHQAGVVGEVLETLARHEVPPHSINVELTESMLMEDARAQLQVLPALQVAGVGVAIDDFGTGYSSLSYLRRFRVDTLKIDRSFLGGTDDADAWAIVRMIVALATGMRVSVVAEGVETEEQKRMLVALGCDKAQGYLFDKPLDPEVATERLAARLTGNTV
jgi:EAL domain-containing protein (putative c-di-GMP-specific phosphodiesterase class I)